MKDGTKKVVRPKECRLCSFRPVVNNSGGNSNLVSHLKNKHSTTYVQAYHDLVAGSSSLMTDFVTVTVSEKALNAYRWIDWIVKERRELSFCEKPRTRKYTTLSPLCCKTLKDYMHAVEKQVREKIKRLLHDKPFGFLFDAWTEAGTHYVAVIAVTSDPRKASKYLLSFAPLRDETNLTADAFVEHFDFVLERYALDCTRLCFVVCDHTAVNGKCSRDAQVPMIGCASHRLQIAVGKILEPHEPVLAKVNELMRRLGSLKNRARLYDNDAPMPVQRNATRWSSTFAMVDCYFKLKDAIDRKDVAIAAVCTSTSDEIDLETILQHLKDIESVSKCLQCDTENETKSDTENDAIATAHSLKAQSKPLESAATLAEVQTLFDGIIKMFPAAKPHLAARTESSASRRGDSGSTRKSDSRTTNVVKSANFENGVVKVLTGCESKLTGCESKLTDKEEEALVRLRSNCTNEENPDKRLSFAARLLQDVAAPKTSKYMDLRWIPATSNEVERLFSRAGIVLSKRRRAMYPMTLEVLMFLDYNDSLWDPYVVAQAIAKPQTSKKQRIL